MQVFKIEDANTLQELLYSTE